MVLLSKILKLQLILIVFDYVHKDIMARSFILFFCMQELIENG